METAALTLRYEVAKDVQLGKFCQYSSSSCFLNLSGGIEPLCLSSLYLGKKITMCIPGRDES